ncbi:MAG: shikimate dehydrogenase [Rubrivivax sp.]
MKPTAAARYAVIGHPVHHSQSPFIHAEFARQTGEPIEYGRLECALDGFADAVRSFAAGGAQGCNVTVPFKLQSGALAERVTPRAQLAQAANLLRFDAGGWLADNTDGIGLVRDIGVNAGFDLARRTVLLIGAGGAAAGVLGPLIAARPRHIRVVNRTPDKAHGLVHRHAAWAEQHGVTLQAGALEDFADGLTGRFDLVLNCSASSLHGAAVPVSAQLLAPRALAVDLMYGAAAEPFVHWARTAGAEARDGLGMLVEQAAEAFFVWRGAMPHTAPVLQALRQRLAPSLPR